MKTYEILENGTTIGTRRARSAENAIRAWRKCCTIYASDYNTTRGAIVLLEWTARATEGDANDNATLTMRARAR